ncbi:MAG: adenosylmethionine decarboxylase [Thiotrichaceae bacterium]
MTCATLWPSFVDKERLQANTSNEVQDLFIKKEGMTYAGTHLILDVWKADHLDDLALIEKALRDCVEVSGATLLHIHLHHFTPNGGVSGVAVLAESHISIHTWPERDYAALDIFMCGETEPMKCIKVLSEAFVTEDIDVTTLLRGQVRSQVTDRNSSL